MTPKSILDLIQIVGLRGELRLEMALEIAHCWILLGCLLEVVANEDLTMILIVPPSDLTLRCPLRPEV